MLKLNIAHLANYSCFGNKILGEIGPNFVTPQLYFPKRKR